MANNPYVNRVETADGTTLMDISDTTATEGDVISGKTLYKANGQRSVGTLGPMTGASASADGTSGLVPAPASGKQASFLRGDATWVVPTDTKNTAGSTDSSSKLFLVGATSQDVNPQTYSNEDVYAENGDFNAKSVTVSEHCTMQWNETDQCLDFVFA